MEEISKGRWHRSRRRVAASLYTGTAVVSLVMGATYGLRDSFMPYHAAALGQSWGELDPASRVLIKALMDVAAGGWLALGLLVLLFAGVMVVVGGWQGLGSHWASLAPVSAREVVAGGRPVSQVTHKVTVRAAPPLLPGPLPAALPERGRGPAGRRRRPAPAAPRDAGTGRRPGPGDGPG